MWKLLKNFFGAVARLFGGGSQEFQSNRPPSFSGSSYCSVDFADLPGGAIGCSSPGPFAPAAPQAASQETPLTGDPIGLCGDHEQVSCSVPSRFLSTKPDVSTAQSTSTTEGGVSRSGRSQKGRRIIVGCSVWGRTSSFPTTVVGAKSCQNLSR